MTTHAATAQPSYLVDTGKRKGLLAWLTTTDHKRIGVLYLYSMISFFLIAMGVGFVMRLVQLTTFQKLITAQTYNALFTLHGVVMIFLFIIPGIPAALGNFDIAVMGAVLLHCRDPLRIVEQCGNRAKSLIIVDKFHPELEGAPVCRLAPTPQNFLWHTWWHFSTQFFTQFLAVMGFTTSEPVTHQQFHRGRAHTLFTLVGAR